jgi:hypothetical protein
VGNIDFTGWLLDEARAFLESDPQTREYSVTVIETAPPLRPVRADAPRKKPVKPGSKSNRPSMEFGAWRILRCRMSTASASASMLELLVAREQIIAASL